jgi:hypothetical protein
VEEVEVFAKPVEESDDLGGFHPGDVVVPHGGVAEPGGWRLRSIRRLPQVALKEMVTFIGSIIERRSFWMVWRFAPNPLEGAFNSTSFASRVAAPDSTVVSAVICKVSRTLRGGGAKDIGEIHHGGGGV